MGVLVPNGIRKCNIFITGMQVNTLPGNVTQKDKEQWMGEAYTMRALYYWQLVKRYGGVPIIKEELGVDHDFSSDRRATFNECVKFIIEDAARRSNPRPVPSRGRPIRATTT